MAEAQLRIDSSQIVDGLEGIALRKESVASVAAQISMFINKEIDGELAKILDSSTDSVDIDENLPNETTLRSEPAKYYKVKGK